MNGLKILGIALSITAYSAAFASGWMVSVSTSEGLLFRPSPSQPAVRTNVLFTVNNLGPFSPPAAVFVGTLPQITFQTAAGIPNPILVGDGTFFTGGTYSAAYTITSTKSPLIGFNFVLQGFVWDLGQIIWAKKVVDINTSRVLYNGSGVFSGASYSGGSNGSVGFLQYVALAAPSSNVQVIETFVVHIDGAPAPGISAASLLLVEQDWVPEPASILALSAGLAGLILRRRAKK